VLNEIGLNDMVMAKMQYEENIRSRFPLGVPLGGLVAILVINHLNASLSWDAQKIDLLGSMNGIDSCVHLGSYKQGINTIQQVGQM